MGTLRNFAVALLAMAAASTAQAATLTFEGLQNNEAVNTFYDGGTGDAGSRGPDYNIRFSGGGTVAVDSDEDDTSTRGNFGGEPSPDNAFFFFGNPLTINVGVGQDPSGFTGGLSFYYSAHSSAITVTVYQGFNGPDNTNIVPNPIRAQVTLPNTPFNGAGDPNGDFSPFELYTIVFDGRARSVVFSGNSASAVFDNMQFGVIPVPAAFPLLATGLAALALLRRRRRA